MKESSARTMAAAVAQGPDDDRRNIVMRRLDRRRQRLGLDPPETVIALCGSWQPPVGGGQDPEPADRRRSPGSGKVARHRRSARPVPTGGVAVAPWSDR